MERDQWPIRSNLPVVIRRRLRAAGRQAAHGGLGARGRRAAVDCGCDLAQADGELVCRRGADMGEAINRTKPSTTPTSRPSPSSREPAISATARSVRHPARLPARHALSSTPHPEGRHADLGQRVAAPDVGAAAGHCGVALGLSLMAGRQVPHDPARRQRHRDHQRLRAPVRTAPLIVLTPRPRCCGAATTTNARCSGSW